MNYCVEIWDKKFGIDGKSLNEVFFHDFESAISYAEKIENPVTIWRNGCRVMDIG